VKKTLKDAPVIEDVVEAEVKKRFNLTIARPE
jgi:hypothetical protein